MIFGDEQLAAFDVRAHQFGGSLFTDDAGREAHDHLRIARLNPSYPHRSTA